MEDHIRYLKNRKVMVLVGCKGILGNEGTILVGLEVQVFRVVQDDQVVLVYRVVLLVLVVLEVLVVLVVLEHIKSKFELTTGLELATGLELGLATELGTEPLITLLAAHLEQVQLERGEEIITISF